MVTVLDPLSDQPSLQERTYQALRTAIIDGRYMPGDRIYEEMVARALAVSRNPVREAVRRLQQDGLVVVRPHNGTFVASIPPDEIEDVYRIRGALEGVAAALAAERMTEPEIVELGRIVNEQRGEASSTSGMPSEPLSASQADRFHRSIHVGARSPRLLTLLEQIYAQVTHFRNLTLRVPGRATASAEGHASIYEAIEGRDGQAAEQRMLAHVRDARDVLILQLRDHLEDAGDTQGA
jgi:DNA-binding GntR family transcriptional regulator